jgi:hypothetical protein
VTVADRFGKLAEVVDSLKLIRFDDDVVVSETVEFNEARVGHG